jgi:hypothetical protein
MSKSKSKKSNGKLLVFVLMVIFIIICVVAFANKDNNNGTNNINKTSKTAFEVYVQNELLNSDFLEFVNLSSGLTDKNQKLEFCINRLMSTNSVNKVSIKDIINYYTKIFGNDDEIENFLNMDMLIHYKLLKDSEEYIKNDNYVEAKIEVGNNFTLESFKEENGKVLATFKIVDPKNVFEFLSYFANKIEEYSKEEYENMMDRLNGIAVKNSNLTKEDTEYLVTLAQKDIDTLAYVSRFHVLFQKDGNNFIIEDIKR